VQYAPVHEIELVPGGELQRIAGAGRVKVNSLHSQGVQRLGDGLEVEARAPDGLVEGFACAVPPASRSRCSGTRVAGDEEPILASTVCRLGRGGAGARKRTTIMSTPIRQFFKEHGISESRPSCRTWPASRAAR